MTGRDALRIALETGLHPDTVVRIVKGDSRFRYSTLVAICNAATKLGIALSPELESGKVRAT